VPSFGTAIRRGFGRRCPSCGQGNVFARWYRMRERCETCGYDFREAKGDNFAFMYLSMAALNGALFLAIYFFGPADWTRKRIMLGVAIVALNVLTIPFRKALSLGLDLWIDEHDR
jgi:uncharacterized protein (DUF983 family)